MIKKDKNKYSKPSIKSSKIKIISFYGRSSGLEGGANGEGLMAAEAC